MAERLRRYAPATSPARLVPGPSGARGRAGEHRPERETPAWYEKSIVYPTSELALGRGAGAVTETTKPSEASAPHPPWKPAPPPDDPRLPWS